jgi:hypothetical protein
VAHTKLDKQKMKVALDRAQSLSEKASEATKRARREKDIKSHRDAVHAHCKANIAWTKAHRRAIDYGTKPWERKTYDRYVRHYDRVRDHWQVCYDMKTRLGLSFPNGAPCARTSEYLWRQK